MGGRLTKERLSLLKTVCNMKGHFQPAHVLEAMRSQGYGLSLATVYRTLSLLAQAGIVTRVGASDDPDSAGSWYEHTWRREHHDHLVCTHCGAVIEFSYPAIEVLQEAVAREHGFVLEGHSLELKGICARCRENITGGVGKT
ncbi:MAG TPA: transcriptional repressor [Deltaproteobacteria bacterium]|nr:transcriptional repressor [Deltaproteobacteria bacterium]